ncbi:cytidylyltransferase domain-containing protein [Paenibacillus sp. R14(2021)]|uniref:acylneuraminate cytidylyltransferase family protein n=1 Tax=Paenibacillus sp. R14(2021) TaxID=2859228 RepID=UPI001C61283A|nr:acylneuraminate cytidylyltransferase family protein [Paenibacillus sp. R14(2021)]
MIDGKKVLAVIPARGGSKGLPRKNIRLLDGKPLLAWTLDAAMASKYIDYAFVSTDSLEIAAAAREWGGQVPFMRPAELAQDDTPGISPVIHAIEMLKTYEIVLLLQPTSPFRIAEDIDGCLEQLVASGASSVVSVTDMEKPLSWMFTVSEESRVLAPAVSDAEFVLQRQAASKVYVLNGAVYAAYSSFIVSNQSFFYEGAEGYKMPKDRSLDIDTMLDFVVAESMIQLLKK